MDTQERTYTTDDRSDWGPGPWDEEPYDKVQFVDEATGLPCLAKRSHFGGNWCGYVGVPPGHPLYGVPYQDGPELDVHGGLTYSDVCQEGPEEFAICHIPAPGEPDHVWWFGFDCGHAWDLAPGMQATYRRYGLDLPGVFDETYRTLAYVRNECARLAAQLVAVGKDAA